MRILKGFERDLMKMISDGFRWDEAELTGRRQLVEGRTLFAQDLPEPALIESADPGASLPYDKAVEPVVCIYRQPATRRRPRGGSFEFSALMVLRSPKSLQKAVDLLDELDDWLADEETGLIGEKFKVGAVTIVGEATAFSRGGDDASFASSTVRFLAVPLID
jgi:hypothetical protein